MKIQKSLNRGIAVARGEYIARIDDDDVWLDSEKLKKQVAFLKSNPSYVIVGTGGIALIASKGIQIKALKPETDIEIRSSMLLGCPFLHPSVVYRRSAIEAVGPYNEDLAEAEDYDLWLRFGRVGKMYNLPQYAIQSLAGESNRGHKKRKEIIVYNLKLIRHYRSCYPNFYLGYLKNVLEYIDASFPGIRKLLWPIYKIRRMVLNIVDKTAVVERL